MSDFVEFLGDGTIAMFLAFGIAIGLSIALHEFAIAILRAATNEFGLGRQLIRHGSRITRVAAVLVGIAVVLPLAKIDPPYAELLRRILRIGVSALLAWSLIAIINASAEFVLRENPIDVEDNLVARRVHTQIRVLQQVALIVVVLIAAGVILMSFPTVRAVGFSLFASAGVAGIVLGFAARPILTNLIAGIQIALAQPIRIDDVVIVEGEWGWIEEITTTYVVVRIWDLRRLVVPLSHFIEKPFQNWTRESASIIGSVTWHVDYRAPVDEMRSKLKEFVGEHPLWDGSTAKIQVIEAEDTTIKVRAIVSARNAPNAWDLRCDIREAMINWLQREHPAVLPRLRADIGITR